MFEKRILFTLLDEERIEEIHPPSRLGSENGYIWVESEPTCEESDCEEYIGENICEFITSFEDSHSSFFNCCHVTWLHVSQSPVVLFVGLSEGDRVVVVRGGNRVDVFAVGGRALFSIRRSEDQLDAFVAN